MQKEVKDEDEIYIIQIIAILLKKIWLIIICAVIMGAIAYFYTTYRIEPVYETSLKLIVNTPSSNTDTDVNNYTPINTSTKLVNTYIQILGNRNFLTLLSNSVDNRYTVSELNDMITLSQQDDTAAIIQVDVKGHNIEDIYNIAVAFGKNCSEQLEEYIKVGDVKILEEPIKPINPVAPDVKKYTIIAALLGAIICSFIIILLYYLDNRVKSAQELGERYNIPVLGEIPDILGNNKGAKYNYGEKK